jgi:hypothetical protein
LAPVQVWTMVRKWSVAFALVPFVALSFAIPFVNRVEPRVLGLPFLLAWIVAWMLLTPGFVYLTYRLDRK